MLRRVRCLGAGDASVREMLWCGRCLGAEDASARVSFGVGILVASESISPARHHISSGPFRPAWWARRLVTRTARAAGELAARQISCSSTPTRRLGGPSFHERPGGRYDSLRYDRSARSSSFAPPANGMARSSSTIREGVKRAWGRAPDRLHQRHAARAARARRRFSLNA
jgi:hypothetical protein